MNGEATTKMVQVVDVWGTITGEKGLAVRNLFLRGRALVWRQQIGGKRKARRIPVRLLRDGEVLGRDLVKQAVDWMKRAESIALDESRGWDALNGTRAKTESPTFGEVFAIFEQAARRRGEPSDKSVYGYIWALRKVVATVEGLDDVGKVDGLRLSLLAGSAGGDVVTKYVDLVQAERGESDSTARSIKSTVNQARQIFQSSFMEEYERLKLPDVSRFLSRFTVSAEAVARVPFSAEQARILGSGKELRDAESVELRALYPFWFLGYYCALRPGESVQARSRWVREYEITPADRAPWMGDRKRVWILDCGCDPDTQLKTAASAGIVPLADDVAEELLRICADGREFIVPGESPTARAGRAREFASWLIGKGWRAGKGQKKGHDLRALRMQKWVARFEGDETIAKTWMRHEVKGVSRNYLGRISMAKVLAGEPMGLEG